MFIIVSTSRFFEISGEYESIDAAIQAIKDRAGLYASSVKVGKRYVNKLGSEAVRVSFLGEKFNVREIPCEKRAYVITCRYPEDKELPYPSFELEESEEIIQFISESNLCTYEFEKKSYTFATRGLALLVLAWFAFVTKENSFDFQNLLYNQQKELKETFDNALNTGRFYNYPNTYFVEAVNRNENDAPLCAEDLKLPESYADGFALYAPDQSSWR